jgi:hypothetical protein
MTHSSEGRSNGITTDELRQMLGPKSAARLSEKTMGELAHEINGFRWPEDPPSKLGDPGHVPILEMDDDSFWDFREVFGAATTLRDSLDKMRSFAAGLVLRPEVDANLQRLQRSLLESIEFIEFPFEAYERGYAPVHIRSWHPYASAVAFAIKTALEQSGVKDHSLGKDCLIPRITFLVLERMKVPDFVVTQSGVAAFLVREEKRLRHLTQLAF